MKMAESSSLKHVQYFRAPDDRRPIAIFISGQFDEFEKFPPFMETEEEIQHVREAYKITDPLLERTTKAHVTDNSWPLQIILLERDPGGTTLPHYHVPTEALPELPTRHQILVCRRTDFPRQSPTNHSSTRRAQKLPPVAHLHISPLQKHSNGEKIVRQQ